MSDEIEEPAYSVRSLAQVRNVSENEIEGNRICFGYEWEIEHCRPLGYFFSISAFELAKWQVYDDEVEHNYISREGKPLTGELKYVLRNAVTNAEVQFYENKAKIPPKVILSPNWLNCNFERMEVTTGDSSIELGESLVLCLIPKNPYMQTLPVLTMEEISLIDDVLRNQLYRNLLQTRRNVFKLPKNNANVGFNITTIRRHINNVLV